MKRKILVVLVFSLLIITSLSVSSSENQSTEKYGESTFYYKGETWYNPLFKNVLVRIDTTYDNVVLPRGVEVVGGKPGEWIDVILPQVRLSELSKAEIDYSVLISDVDSYSQSVAGTYHTLAETEQILSDIADNYPSITSLYSIGKSYQNRDIWCLEITDNPGVDEGEPGVFFMGLHHAREWPTIEICLYIADQLTSQYGLNPAITDIVDNRRLWLVTCVNPDGYYYCHDQGHDWRKNRHYFPEFSTWGVDLNRNYDGSSNGDPWGAWGSIGPGSVTHNSSEETYCGPSQMSELETQAVRDIFLENDICACITWHTYSELVLWPWAYSGFKHTPDDTYMAQVGQEIASRITRQSGSGTYTPTQAAGLYPTTGDTTDWAYGYAHFIQGRPTFAYTIEACSQFQPPVNLLDQVVEENFDGALYLLQEAGNIADTVAPRVLPPEIDEMSYDPDGNYIVSWQEQNPEAEPDYFQLDELTDLYIVTDDAESDSTLWDLDGFSLSVARYHSDFHSFKSRRISEDVSSMTTVYPIPVTEDMSLSFWCWYETEKNWDYAFVEVSRNGRTYDILDSFTGSSNDWEYKEYNLTEYVGDSIFIRFRHTTDPVTTKEGFYVDDISPIANFETVNTLTNSTTNNYYEVTGKSNGTYYYRVKGYNNERDWGDFSMLEMITVGVSGDNEPPTVNITRPKENFLYLFNREIIPFSATVIIFDIDVEVNTSDPSGIERVEFYVDNMHLATDKNAPYDWTWTGISLLRFRHTIKINSYDNYNNKAEKKMTVWRFF